jgi:exodeoxyribonuclease-1
MTENMQSFYFYDLETTGLSAQKDRVMQFAGQRTNLELKPIGEPDNFYIKITSDVLPSPDAVLVTGITPQKTLDEGISEAEFLKYFYKKIAMPGTIFIGFNSIRFDDEFMRYMNYRNFYDAYEWQWSEERSKWDLLDVVRMTRALRPENINWPFASDGTPVNKLELLTELNKLDHTNAHDALSDVFATIAVAKLIKTKQPRLFDYLLSLRTKAAVEKIVNSSRPFVYTSGRYSSEYEKTTIALSLANHPLQNGSFIVYDLRIDPTEYTVMSAEELATKYQNRYDKQQPPLPFKILQTNKCPTVAPIGVLRDVDKKRLKISDEEINQHYKKLATAVDFGDKLSEAFRLNESFRQEQFIKNEDDVDSQLYDGFFDSADKSKMRQVTEATADQLVDLSFVFNDPRLRNLLILYKARQFPRSLTEEEAVIWRDYQKNKLIAGKTGHSRAEQFFKRLEELAEIHSSDTNKMYLLEELQLYAQSVIPDEY